MNRKKGFLPLVGRKIIFLLIYGFLQATRVHSIPVDFSGLDPDQAAALNQDSRSSFFQSLSTAAMVDATKQALGKTFLNYGDPSFANPGTIHFGYEKSSEKIHKKNRPPMGMVKTQVHDSAFWGGSSSAYYRDSGSLAYSSNLSVGAATQVTPHVLLGIGMGVGDCKGKIIQNWGEKRSSGSNFGMFFRIVGSPTGDSCTVEHSTFFSFNQYRQIRKLGIFGLQATNHHREWDVSSVTEVDYLWETPYAHVGPLILCSVAYTQENGYRETGAQAFNLEVPKRQSTSFREEVGIIINKNLSNNTVGSVRGQIKMLAGLKHGLHQTTHTTFSFITDPCSFTLTSRHKPIMYGAITFGLLARLGKNFLIKSYARSDFYYRTQSVMGFINLVYDF